MSCQAVTASKKSDVGSSVQASPAWVSPLPSVVCDIALGWQPDDDRFRQSCSRFWGHSLHFCERRSSNMGNCALNIPLSAFKQDIFLPTRFLNASSDDQSVSGPEIDGGTLFGLRLTRAGREIASVLAQRVDAEYFGDGGQWLSNLLGASAVVEWRREPAKDWIAIPVSKKNELT
jgi:hypothetical protein